jgi:hypothetical protein
VIIHRSHPNGHCTVISDAAIRDVSPIEKGCPNVMTVAEVPSYRSLTAWALAASHLNTLGLAAAVPGPLVPVLQRGGLVVWAAGVADDAPAPVTPRGGRGVRAIAVAARRRVRALTRRP